MGIPHEKTNYPTISIRLTPLRPTSQWPLGTLFVGIWSNKGLISLILWKRIKIDLTVALRNLVANWNRNSPFQSYKKGGTFFSGGSAAYLSRIVEGLLLSVKRVQLVITRKALPHFIHLNFFMLEGCIRTTPAKFLGILNDKFIC